MHQGYPQAQDQISPGTVPYHYERNAREPPSAPSNGFVRPEYSTREPTGFAAGVGRPSPPLMPYHARPSLGHTPASMDRYAMSSERNADRRSSIIVSNDYPTPRYEPHPVSGPRPYHGTPQYALPLRDEYSPRKVPRYESRAQEPVEAIPGFNRGGFQDAQASFFMPSHYDYQQGKTRKRSNLPKQSTEIMKTWFDQVCIRENSCYSVQVQSLTYSRTSPTHIPAKSRRQSSLMYVSPSFVGPVVVC